MREAQRQLDAVKIETQRKERGVIRPAGKKTRTARLLSKIEDVTDAQWWLDTIKIEIGPQGSWESRAALRWTDRNPPPQEYRIRSGSSTPYRSRPSPGAGRGTAGQVDQVDQVDTVMHRGHKRQLGTNSSIPYG
jgi:hypothetical protein